MDKYDVIVIGAGNGGLAAASMASKNGLKTLLFERHNLPGGAVSSFRRGRFEFEPSLHEMCGAGSEENPGETRKILKQLGSTAGLVFENTCYRVISTDPKDPFDVTLPATIEGFCAAVEKDSPGSGEKVKTFIDLTQSALETANKLSSKKISFKDFPAILNTFRMVSYSSDKVMDLLGIPKHVQHFITPYWTYVGEPTSTLSAFMMGMMDYCYADDGATIPTHFSHELSLSLDKAIRDNGGKIFYNSPVTKILIKNNKAYGVIANGKEYYADNIICNCYPNDAFGKMMDKGAAPKSAIKRTNARQIALSFVNLHLGLNKTAQELGIKDYTTFILPQADSTEQWKASHGLGGDSLIIANNLNVLIPDCSPEGTCHMSITACIFGDEWSKVKPEEYKKTKLKVAEKILNYYHSATGINLKPYIEEIEVATPVTYSRYLGSPNGTPYGYQTSNWDGIFLRTMYLNKEKDVKGLRFVGAHSENSLGYNMTYKSGLIAVEEILNAK